MKIPDFSKSIYKLIKFSKNIDILVNASAIDVSLKENSSLVDLIKIKSIQGKNGLVKAKQFILANGCIEIARLLLNSNKEIKTGIGNEFNNVGRYFQDHCSAITALFMPKNKKIIEQNFNSFLLNDIKYMPRLFLNPIYANKYNCLHSSIQLIYPENYTDRNDFQNTLSSYKNLYQSLRKKKDLDIPFNKMFSIGIRLPFLIPQIYEVLIKRRIPQPKSNFIWIECHTEQEPSKDSRIKLNYDHIDKIGMPRVDLDWKINEKIYHTMKTSTLLIKKEFEELGIGKIIIDNWIDKYDQNWRSHIGDVYHQAGTTRMSNNPIDGVVNKNLRLFNHQNLFIAGASVFPTSSCANPTFTAIALSIRLCDHIKNLNKF